MVFPRRKELTISLSYIRFIYHLILFNNSKVKKLIEEDIQRWLVVLGINKPISNSRALIFLLKYHKPFRNVYYIRINKTKRLLKLIAQEYSGFYFLKSTKLKGGLFLYHPFSTIINARYLGKNCTIRNNITIGNVSDDNNKLPTLGDNVNIGAGAIIIGNIIIGNNVTIGAGAVVVKSVPDNCVVVGSPAYIVKRNDSKYKETLKSTKYGT